jgi:hypothetical protein
VFGQRTVVGVVSQDCPDGNAEPMGHHFREWDVAPLEIRCQPYDSAVPIDDARHTGPDADKDRVVVGIADHFLNQCRDRVRGGLRIVVCG